MTWPGVLPASDRLQPGRGPGPHDLALTTTCYEQPAHAPWLGRGASLRPRALVFSRTSCRASPISPHGPADTKSGRDKREADWRPRPSKDEAFLQPPPRRRPLHSRLSSFSQFEHEASSRLDENKARLLGDASRSTCLRSGLYRLLHRAWRCQFVERPTGAQ